MSLAKYFKKNVKIKDKNNKYWRGFVSIHTPADDNEDGLESICIDMDKKDNPELNINGLYEYNENEIKEIEIVD